MSKTLVSIKILGRRLGSPGTFKVSVQGVDGSQLPDGVEIATGSVSADAWTTDVAGAWYEITLDSSVVLTDDVMYALVFTAPNEPAGEPDQIMLRSDTTSPTYTRGHFCEYATFWAKDTGKDFLFEARDASNPFEYYITGGTTWQGLVGTNKLAQTFTPVFVFIPPSDMVTYKRLVVAANSKIFYEDI